MQGVNDCAASSAQGSSRRVPIDNRTCMTLSLLATDKLGYILKRMQARRPSAPRGWLSRP
jgi:hypothetical protein